MPWIKNFAVCQPAWRERVRAPSTGVQEDRGTGQCSQAGHSHLHSNTCACSASPSSALIASHRVPSLALLPCRVSQGTILIAVNPLRKVEDPDMKNYMNRSLDPEAPHPYAIAEVGWGSHSALSFPLKETRSFCFILVPSMTAVRSVAFSRSVLRSFGGFGTVVGGYQLTP